MMFSQTFSEKTQKGPRAEKKFHMYFHSDAQLLLNALLVLRASPYHQGWSIQKMETYIIAAIKNGKLLVVYDREQRPVGLFTWAYLPADRESRYMADPSSLVASDFESNDGTLWAIDFAAPFGFCRDVVRALRHEFPKGTKFKIYRTEQNRFGWMIA